MKHKKAKRTANRKTPVKRRSRSSLAGSAPVKRRRRSSLAGRTKTVTRYRSVKVPVKAHKRRTLKLGNSIFGASFSIKNLVVSTLIGGGGAFALSYGHEYLDEKLKETYPSYTPMISNVLAAALTIGVPYVFRKNRKALKYIVPASIVFGGNLISKTIKDYSGVSSPSLGAGTTYLGAGYSNLGAGVQNLRGMSNRSYNRPYPSKKSYL